MKVHATDLPDVLIVESDLRSDHRGWFLEMYNRAFFEEHRLPVEYAQDNHSRSRSGVIRGLHYQLDPPQGKLVRCIRGAIHDVAVDIRRGSPTFGKWTAAKLTESNGLALWVPAGFAHGFAALEDSDVVYKCTTMWNPATERTIVWNDPDIGIEWPVSDPVMSEKDRNGTPLATAEVFAS